jgi:hypothetical protein
MNLSQSLVDLLSEYSEKNLEQLLEKGQDNLHQCLRQLPIEPEVGTKEYKIRRQVLLSLYHLTCAIGEHEGEEEDDNRGSGRFLY